jgi:hypothetical protein
MLKVVKTQCPSPVAAVRQSTQRTWWITDEEKTPRSNALMTATNNNGTHHDMNSNQHQYTKNYKKQTTYCNAMLDLDLNT